MSRIHAVKAIGLIWMGTLAGAGLAFLCQLILARNLGAEAFGIFSSALNFTTLISSFAGFGVAQLWLRVFGQEGWRGVRWIDGSLRFIALTSLASIGVLIAWGIWGPHDRRMEITLLVLTIYLLGQLALDLVSSKLQLEERYYSLALWQVLPQLFRFVFIFSIFVLLRKQVDEIWVSAIYSLVALGLIIFAVLVLKDMRGGGFKLKGHSENLNCNVFSTSSVDVRLVARESWAFGVSGFFYLIYFQSAVILLKYLRGPEAAGFYNVAFVVMAAVYLLPSVIYQKYLLSKIHRWASHDRDKLVKALHLGNKVMLALGLVAMVGVWLLADVGVVLLFGGEYRDAGALIRVLSLAIPIRFLATSVGAPLATQENMKRKVWAMGWVASLNILFSFALIPLVGGLGAAWTAVGGDALLLALYWRLLRKYVLAESVLTH